MKQDKKEFLRAKQLRERAEQELKDRQNRKEDDTPPMDLKRLLHELQVHQIELELQNEELQKARDDAQEALKKYTVFFDFAPVAYLMLDQKATICELNFAAAALLGEERLNLLNSNIRLFLSETSLSQFNDFFRSVYSSAGREVCEVLLVNQNESLLAVHLEGVVIDEDDKCFLAAINLADLR